MGELKTENKNIVVPGEVIAKGMDYLPSDGTYRTRDLVRANMLGTLKVEGKVLKVRPFSGRYMPKKDDKVIGRVEDIMMSGWRFDLNAAYNAVLPLKNASFDYIERGSDLTKYFDLDDYAVLKVTNVTSQNLIDVTAKGQGLKRLRGGRIVKVNNHKVPRIIGRGGNMVNMIKNATETKIIIGQNGVIWLEGSPESEVIAVRAIKEVEKRAHERGLTEDIQKFLEEKTGKKL